MKDGFIKVASASPVIKVVDTEYNAERVIESIKAAGEKGVKLLVFPELVLTGCTCFDLTGHSVVLRGAKRALLKVINATAGVDMLVFVGLPVAVGSRLYSCAAAIYDGELLGLVPRENVRGTQFSEPTDAYTEVEIDADHIAVLSTDNMFCCAALPELKVAAELGADIDALVPPSVRHAQAGATLIAQLASFPATVSSADETELTLRAQSRRLHCGMVLAAPGKGESSTDNVFSGLCMIAENGEILASDERENSMAVSELDIEYIVNSRRGSEDFDLDCDEYYESVWGGEPVDTVLTRSYRKYPHLPASEADMPNYCERMLDIQVSGLVKRMEYAGLDHCVVGISGGVDSTLAVIICAEGVKMMGLPADYVTAVTMPCFGTTDRTKSNAIIVSEQLGATVRVIDIGESVMQHFKDIGHDPENRNVVYENSQARERTQILMDVANGFADGGIHVGTEDMSEFADGWCTYNGDHISMYDVNAGSTKTMVQMVVRYVAETTEDKVLAKALLDVLDTPVSPELLPPTRNGEIAQKSEDSVGPYNLQDFFLYYLVDHGFAPEKVLRLADIAYGDEFDHATLKKWLRSYCRRLFSQQFKRSCLQDGPTLNGFSFSPRTGFSMPSDGSDALYLATVDALK